MTKTSHNPWPEILNQLQRQMTRATFDAWLSGTQAEIRNGHLVVIAHNSMAVDWLENRLRDQIEQVASRLTEKMPIRFVPKEAELQIEGIRKNGLSEIIQPDRVFVGSQYFREKWQPLLGPVAWCLILELRQKCYWNKETGEKRETCRATYAELGAAIGKSEKTARRALAEDRPYIEQFILHRETLKRYSEARGKRVNEATLWWVRLDDPPTPEDLNHLIVKMSSRSAPNGQNVHCT